MADAPTLTHLWDDPLFLGTQFSSEEKLIRDAAHGYAQSKLMPRVKSAYREERFKYTA